MCFPDLCDHLAGFLQRLWTRLKINKEINKINLNSSGKTRRYKVGVCYLQHVGGLLAPLGHVLRLSQQIVEEARFIQLANKLALEAVLHMVDQEVHHCLRHTAAEGGRGRKQTEQMV